MRLAHDFCALRNATEVGMRFAHALYQLRNAMEAGERHTHDLHEASILCKLLLQGV